MKLFSKKENNVPETATNKDKKKKEEIPLTPEEEAERDELLPYLVMRSYHLPNYTYYQDLYQYMTNNHPVFGIFFHHKYHPVGFWVRIASLIGSALFGLAITNIVYLAFVFTDQDYDRAYVEIPSNMTGHENIESYGADALSVTNGNIALWTIGAFLHASYDNLIWSVAACACLIKPGTKSSERIKRYKSMGTFFVMLSVVVVVAITTFAVTIRAALDDDGDGEITAVEGEGGIKSIHLVTGQQQPKNTIVNATVNATDIDDDNVSLFKAVDPSKDFEFIIAYLIELVLNYFVFYPVVGTILFSGVLVCGNYPMLGGRPFEIKQMELERKLANGEPEEQGEEVQLEEGKKGKK